MQEVEPLSPNGGYKDRRVVQDTSTNPPTTYEIFFPYGPQSHPDQLGINVGGWDHNLEVCAYEGDCGPLDSQCINAYTLEMQDDLGENVYFLTPTQIPADGAGDLLMLRATPSKGPYPPCPIGTDGRQIPCMPKGEKHRGATVRGFYPTEAMHFYVDELAIENLVHITDSSFTMRVSYDIMWSARFAVHPCKISLYPYGDGVPSNGKKV